MLILILFILVGVIFVVGAYQKWEWLVDPPERMSSGYSQAFLKKLIGKEGLLIYTYFLGILFIVLGIWGLVK